MIGRSQGIMHSGPPHGHKQRVREAEQTIERLESEIKERRYLLRAHRKHLKAMQKKTVPHRDHAQ